MKKLNYFLLGLAGLAMASCSQDDILDSPSASGNYNVTVKLPADLGTRAANMNTGLTANKLSYAVYDADDVLIEQNITTFTEDQGGALSTTVAFNLAAGQSYKISFFAQAEGSEEVYKFDAADKTMTVDYTKMTNAGLEQDDLYDCFVNLLTTGVIGTEVTNTSVLLNRPVAQINWGTNDYGKTSIQQYYGKNLAYIQSTLSTTAYTTFDLLDNDVDKTQTTTVDLGDFTRPMTANNTVAGFPVGGYQYVAMQYVLAPQSEDIIDLNLSINNQVENNPFEGKITNDVLVSNAPIQANFRTNIYGALLSEDLEITVTKNQNWGNSFNLPQGDLGEQISDGLYFNESIKTYTITSPAGLEAYATTIATSDKGFEGLKGYTTVLGKDLDMSGVSHTPFNNAGGIFDGQGHTVSNLKVVATDDASAGFMANAIGTVQNINFKNVDITGNYKAGALAGDGMSSRITNITVDGGTITITPWLNGEYYDDANNVGGIVGYLSAESTGVVTNCSVNGLTITAYRKVGGLVGYANGSCLVENNTVSNTSVTANHQISGTYVPKSADEYLAGEICGGWTTNATVRNNFADGVSVTLIDSDGSVTANIASQEALQAAVGTPNATINLQPGTYTPPTNVASGVTFTGTKDAVITIGQSQVAGYTNVTFDGITFNGAAENYRGFQHSSNLTYKNCTLNGLYFLYADGENFENCNFVQPDASNYNIWTYGATKATFTKCTFSCAGRAINVYQDGTSTTQVTYTFNSCTFNSSQATTKAALEIGTGHQYIINLNNCTATGFSTETASGSSLWTYKDNGSMIINIDGKEVYNSID